MQNYKPIIKLLKRRIENNKEELNYFFKEYGYVSPMDSDYTTYEGIISREWELKSLLKTIQQITTANNEKGKIKWVKK